MLCWVFRLLIWDTVDFVLYSFLTLVLTIVIYMIVIYILDLMIVIYVRSQSVSGP